MKKENTKNVSKCQTSEQLKAENKKPAKTLQSLVILEWKWDHITMDFVVELPRIPLGFDAVWVMINQLTKNVHFLPYKTIASMDIPVKLYVNEVVRLHGVLASIVLDRFMVQF